MFQAVASTLVRQMNFNRKPVNRDGSVLTMELCFCVLHEAKDGLQFES